MEEAISTPIADLFESEGSKFHSGGREDIDVRMLGAGRPFVVELVSPKKKTLATQATLDHLGKVINARTDAIGVSDLQFTDDSCFAALTEAAAAKVKVYGAIVQTEKPLTEAALQIVNGLKDVEIDQMTPLRVLHRRTLMTRDKMIYRCRLIRLNDFTGLLVLLASAGTYIKEFVHGDLNRTKPNLGTILGCKADIIQLDVLDLYPDYSEESVRKYEELADKLPPYKL